MATHKVAVTVDKREAIPGPSPLPLLGNIRDIDVKNTVRSLNELADSYAGPIYRLKLGVANVIIISSYELVNEVLARKEFIKYPVGTVMRMRDVIHDSLITAFHHEENWAIAHRTLVPAFGPLAIKQMFREMHDIGSQLVQKWTQTGADAAIDVAEDLQSLALDTLALCAMDTRFNSFSRDADQPHKLVDALNGIFTEVTMRAARPAWFTKLQWSANRKFDENNAFLRKLAHEVIDHRRANPSDKKDLLNALVSGKDPATGKRLTDDCIINNMMAFLIAGSETTGNLLAFLLYYLVANPKAYATLQKEIDQVLGNGPLVPEHLSKLPYTKACLREALRLQPTVPVLAVKPVDVEGPILLGKKWELDGPQTILVLLHHLHRDASVWGDDAEDFKPERMLDQNFAKLPPNAWKPFGNGQRACIGNEFAFQEATIAVALLFQKLDFFFVDPDYKLSIKQAASIKPANLFMRAKPRAGVDSLSANHEAVHEQTVRQPTSVIENVFAGLDDLKPIIVYYGSNMGTSMELAESLAKSAIQRGFECKTAALDEAMGNLKPGVLSVLISSSYDGQPTSNGARFIDWVSGLNQSSLTGVEFVVFGCGNREWRHTYQRIPNLIHSLLEKRGAKSVAPKGSADALEGDMLAQFATWQTSEFWPTVAKLHGVTLGSTIHEALSVEVVHQKPDFKTPQVGVRVTIKRIDRLTNDETRPKFHLELDLPKGSSYEVGGYLEISPLNPVELVSRALKVLGLVEDTVLKVESLSSTSLPTGVPVLAKDLFLRYLDLNQPATLSQLELLRDHSADAKDKTILDAIIKESKTDVSTRRPSILLILEAFKIESLSISVLIGLFPTLKPRAYSISSSPLSSPTTCTLTWSVIKHSGLSHPQFREIATYGLASKFLSGLKEGDTLSVTVKPSHSAFRLVFQGPGATPLIMVCAGAGIAPFRGFLQHRFELLKQGLQTNIPPAMLFVGCRSPADKLYEDTLREWASAAKVKIFYAFSQDTDNDESAGCRYTQDRLWLERAQVMDLWEQGAKMYVCGSRLVNEGVKGALRRMYIEDVEKKNGDRPTDEQVEEWWVSTRRDRYAVDVF
ncbi:cytochrome P450 [Apiosordaria backusii]|uniref:Bifunctional cytochrome P450/NADPH--P450 reductase n=1 Tax=Apiosordaria backusii TaxID=314023 RepID=A0AA40BDN7_9PEZI|nr:cytochrome P450 [Apiosordaria backusii]